MNDATQIVGEEPATSIGATLRARRRDLGMTQEEIAEAAGVSTRFVGDLERGKPSVRLDHAAAVAAALGLRLAAVKTW